MREGSCRGNDAPRLVPSSSGRRGQRTPPGLLDAPACNTQHTVTEARRTHASNTNTHILKHFGAHTLTSVKAFVEAAVGDSSTRLVVV